MSSDPNPIPNPALARFLEVWDSNRPWGQVLIRRESPGFALRHVADRDLRSDALQAIAPEAIRALANRTASGDFRPLRSAPDLTRGWECRLPDVGRLHLALEELYPGALGDWWAWTASARRRPDFAGFAARQIGSGQALKRLSPASIAAIVRVVCAPTECLKSRQWTAGAEEAADEPTPDCMPCLEPCALWTKFARTCAKLDESASVHLELNAGELATVVAALQRVRSNPPPDLARGDVDSPLHPWRMAHLMERHANVWALVQQTEQQPDSHAAEL